ncbi:MAG: flagellin [Synergistaceae bacterium]|nr:flagellin [Synergistaceae bacterium]
MMIGSNNNITLAYNSLNATNKAMENTARALSTGLRVATAADDAAGFAMAQKMSAQVAGLSRAIKNTQDGVSMLQTAEGAMNQINSMLQRMRELSLQASNDTLTTQDRNYIQLEIDELKNNIDNIARNTTFNQKRLLDGSSAATWSADKLSTRVNITGAITSIDQFGQKSSIEGNYRIEVNATPGKTQVQKTGIFTIPDKSGRDTEDYTQEINLDELSENDSSYGWKFENGVLTINGSGNFSITGNNSAKISVEQGVNAKIRFTDTNTDSLEIDNANVTLVLRGDNALTSGIELKGSTGMLTINSSEGLNREEGTLTLSGITGTQGDITINGGSITSSADSQITVKLNGGSVQGINNIIDNTGIAKPVTLEDIPEFYDASGVFMLTDPQEITITQGDGKKASVMLYRTDTIEDVRKKLNDAIAKDIGQADYTDNEDNFVRFVESGHEDSSGFESVAGTFVIRSAVPGSKGELSFSSDNQDLISAFNLNTIQESTETTYRASVYNAHNGRAIAKNIITDGNTINGVIAPNVNIEFDSMANIKASWNANTKNYILAEDSLPFETTVHIVDRSTAFQVGQNDGEDIYINIADMSAAALGLNSVNLTTRQGANETIGILDQAIHMVSQQRSRLGAYQNELEYNANSLTQTHLHMSEAESRLKDADMATEYMEFVKLQILNNTGNSMLTQANQSAQSLMSILSV